MAKRAGDKLKRETSSLESRKMEEWETGEEGGGGGEVRGCEPDGNHHSVTTRGGRCRRLRRRHNRAQIPAKWSEGHAALFLSLFIREKFNWSGRDAHYIVGKCLRMRFLLNLRHKCLVSKDETNIICRSSDLFVFG